MAGKAETTATPNGAIVHDAAHLGVAADCAWFSPAYWASHGAITALAGGRGGAHLVHTPAGAAVLRHYHRGGFIARINSDRYLWQGQERTRPFREYRLLEAMHDRGLPAPVPLAAQYVRSGCWYRADLLSVAIVDTQTMAQFLCAHPSLIDWALVGATIGRFHAAGFFHADLNAHNILLRTNGCWLIDFDRGVQRDPHPDWQQANIARLRRSLDKLGAGQLVPHYESVAWPALRCAHARVVEAR